MPRYNYTVANQQGKKLSGTVEAPNEVQAKQELNNLGFSILIFKEATPDATPSSENKSNKFVFEAIDKNQKNVTGTIASSDLNKAYERLKNEYALTITAIWPNGADEATINQARQQGTQQLQQELQSTTPKKDQDEKVDNTKQQMVRSKIDDVLKKINGLMQKFGAYMEADQKAEINKQIDKLLRIKNSTNFDYIIKTAEVLLIFIEKQEKTLKEKGLQDERIKLKLETKDLIKEINQKQSDKPKTLSEEIITKISGWQKKFNNKEEKEKGSKEKTLNSILTKIKNAFETPPEVQGIKDQITVYNKQIREFVELYFKEPSPEYKTKVKNSIKTIWQARKQAKKNLKLLKQQIKEQRKAQTGEPLSTAFVKELNALTGWFLTFYIIYYFISLYLNTKDFGLSEIPKGLIVYNSQFFKYILVITFILHSCTALKTNFFQRSLAANIILPLTFIITSIISILNF